MNQPWVYTCSPSRSPLPPPSPSHPSGSSQCTSPEHLSHASNLGWQSVSHLIIHRFQCCSLGSSHPHLGAVFSSWHSHVVKVENHCCKPLNAKKGYTQYSQIWTEKKKTKNRDPEHRETKAKKKSKQWPDPKIWSDLVLCIPVWTVTRLSCWYHVARVARMDGDSLWDGLGLHSVWIPCAAWWLNYKCLSHPSGQPRQGLNCSCWKLATSWVFGSWYCYQ